MRCVKKLESTSFRYYRDPLFLSSSLLYGLNRFGIKPLTSTHSFFHHYFNDILLVPVVLPLVLWLHGKWKLRSISAFPSWKEITFHVILWSILIEGLFPLLFHHGTADFNDVIAYISGAIISGFIWCRTMT